MMFFEEHPWLMVPIIIGTIEAWNLSKQAVRSWWRQRALRPVTNPVKQHDRSV